MSVLHVHQSAAAMIDDALARLDRFQPSSGAAKPQASSPAAAPAAGSTSTTSRPSSAGADDNLDEPVLQSVAQAIAAGSPVDSRQVIESQPSSGSPESAGPVDDEEQGGAHSSGDMAASDLHASGGPRASPAKGPSQPHDSREGITSRRSRASASLRRHSSAASFVSYGTSTTRPPWVSPETGDGRGRRGLPHTSSMSSLRHGSSASSIGGGAGGAYYGYEDPHAGPAMCSSAGYTFIADGHSMNVWSSPAEAPGSPSRRYRDVDTMTRGTLYRTSLGRLTPEGMRIVALADREAAEERRRAELEYLAQLKPRGLW